MRAPAGAGLEDLHWHVAGDEHVVTDELGIPLHPETYSDEFTRMLKCAGLPKIRLHDSRHTALSLMERAGVPISIISKWAPAALRASLKRSLAALSREVREFAISEGSARAGEP
jgi:integrase